MEKLYPKQLYVKKCVVCNTEFSYIQYVSVEKSRKRKTCSKKCRYTLASNSLSGKFFPNGHNQKDLSKWVVYKCKMCNEKINTQRSAKRVFCSRICKAIWQKENLSGENNPNWLPLDERKPYRSVGKRVRKDLIKNREVCEICGTKNKLQVNHNDRNRGNNSDENLTLLCLEHHAQWHENRGEYEIARLIRVNRQSKS